MLLCPKQSCLCCHEMRDRGSHPPKHNYFRSRLEFGECEKWRGRERTQRSQRRTIQVDRQDGGGGPEGEEGRGTCRRAEQACPSVRPPSPTAEESDMHALQSSVDCRLQRVPKCEREWVGQLVSEVCDLHE